MLPGVKFPEEPQPPEAQAQVGAVADVAIQQRKRIRRHRRKGRRGYGLKVCSNQQFLGTLSRAGQAIVVDRDVNAAKNILHLGLRRQKGLKPMKAFSRKKDSTA